MIPKIIHCTWKTFEDLDNQKIRLFDAPNEVFTFKDCLNTFKDKNPLWKIEFYSDERMDSFVKENYPYFHPLFSGLKIIEKVDIFRLIILYEIGGLFIDADCVCLKPLEEFLNKYPEASLIVGQERDEITNWFNYKPHKQINYWSIFTEKGNLIVKRILQNVILNCIHRPGWPLIEKTSMAAFGDVFYEYLDDTRVILAPTSNLSLGANFKYMHGNNTFGQDGLPAYILHGCAGTWKDSEFYQYSEKIQERSSLVCSQ